MCWMQHFLEVSKTFLIFKSYFLKLFVLRVPYVTQTQYNIFRCKKYFEAFIPCYSAYFTYHTAYSGKAYTRIVFHLFVWTSKRVCNFIEISNQSLFQKYLQGFRLQYPTSLTEIAFQNLKGYPLTATVYQQNYIGRIQSV